MELKKEQVKDAVMFDINSEIVSGYGIDGLHYNNRFATVSIGLEETDILRGMVENMRLDAGITPNKGDTYSFSTGFNELTKTSVDTCIVADVQSSACDDDGTSYYIDIGDEAQREVFRVLDKQIKAEFGERNGIDAMLRQASSEFNTRD